jgi:hypothetical protein
MFDQFACKTPLPYLLHRKNAAIVHNPKRFAIPAQANIRFYSHPK